MIKAISYWSMKDGLEGTHPIPDAFTEAKEAGFDGIELCIATEGVLTPQSSEQQCVSIREGAEAAGLVLETLASGMSWGMSPSSDDARVRAESIRLQQEALRRAAWLGCKAMLFIPGIVKCPFAPELVRYETAVERAHDAVHQLADTADEVGVDLCIENVWNGMFYSPVEFAGFIDSIGRERVGVYFDVGNVLGYHQHPPHWIETLGPRIKRVHVKDFEEDFDWQGKYSFCGLGDGQVPWAETMAALRGIGYDRTLVAEMIPWHEGLLRKTRDALDRILK